MKCHLCGSTMKKKEYHADKETIIMAWKCKKCHMYLTEGFERSKKDGKKIDES